MGWFLPNIYRRVNTSSSWILPKMQVWETTSQLVLRDHNYHVTKTKERHHKKGKIFDRKKNSIKKWAKDMNRYISKENIQIANKHMKRYSASLVISSVQLLSHVRLCDPMSCSMPGLPVHHQLRVYSCPLSQWCHPTISSSVVSSSCLNLSQHQGLF